MSKPVSRTLNRKAQAEPVTESAAAEVQRDETSPEHRARLASVDRRQDTEHFSSLADRVAGAKLYMRNYMYPNARKHYPEDIDASMRFVLKYYPYTQFGFPLYIDEPLTERACIRSHEKQALLREMGLKMVVLEQDRTDKESGKVIPATTLEDALSQIGK